MIRHLQRALQCSDQLRTPSRNVVSRAVLLSSTIFIGIPRGALAEQSHGSHDMAMSPMTSYLMDANQCQGAMEYWEIQSGMCQPLPMAGMPMSMVMMHGNVFGVATSEQGPRGRREFAAPNMAMIDAGTTVGGAHYLKAELMATAERWTFPERGIPELLQVGETNSKGEPFVDAQHPHSSPVMGLTISDTFRLSGGRNHLRLFAAPRGASTDGPVAFMHRATGMVNPDAPLGHHIGQDAGHISSSVVGLALHIGGSTFEASAFHGREPEPTKVDLPLGSLNSYAGRVTQELTPWLTAMASGAFIRAPEDHDSQDDFVTRYSASFYVTKSLGDGWTFYDSLIYGAIRNYDHIGLLRSYGEEFLLRGQNANIWGRAELLQRTAEQLAITNAESLGVPRWVTAATIGYTHIVTRHEGTEWGIGTSVTKDFLPSAFRSAYGGEPWTGKIFIQLSGARMTMF